MLEEVIKNIWPPADQKASPGQSRLLTPHLRLEGVLPAVPIAGAVSGMQS